MNVVDVIKLVDDGKPAQRDVSLIKGLTIHRIDRWGDAIEICKRFTSDPEMMKYTGGEVPYTFFINDEGTVWQALPVSEIGRHARRWNVPHIGIAVIGDFRKEVPTGVQLAKLEQLCFELCVALQISWEDVKGHDELPDGSADPTKRCPGKNLSMDHLRSKLRGMLGRDKAALEARLRGAGFIV